MRRLHTLSCCMHLAALLIGSSWAGRTAAAAPFSRGDVNISGVRDISDAITILGYAFLGTPAELPCLDAADVDDGGSIDITDALRLLGYLFLGDDPPPAPFPGCGEDTTPDGLTCESFPPCPTEPSLPLQEPSDDDRDADAVHVVGRVAVNTGELRLDRIDLAIPGRGHLSFAMFRRYRSRRAGDGPLGRGWDFNYNERLTRLTSGDVVRQNGFGHVDTWTRQGDGSYRAPRGHFRSLIDDPGGGFILRAPDGFKRFYTAEGLLERYEDRFGHRMLFFHDGGGNLDLVVDPYGREIDFVFETSPDGREHLARIADFAGREVIYSYDVAGDLIAVRSPVVVGTSTGNDFPQGRTETYAYTSSLGSEDLDHNLAAVFFPQEFAVGGPARLAWTYGTDAADPLSFDRVLTETEGGTNASGLPAGGTTAFAYAQPEGQGGGVSPPEPLRVTITERNGNVQEACFDAQLHLVSLRAFTRGLRPGEPESYRTDSFYDADGQLLRRVFPEGNELVLGYDATGPRAAHRNVLEARIVPGPRGGGEDIVWTYTHEPLYQQVATITDPRGNSGSFVPPIGTATADRYTTRLFFDYQESSAPVPEADRFGIDLSGISRSLGDLNGDGRTDQAAGNLVRAEAPAVRLRDGSNEAQRLGSTLQPIITQLLWNDSGQVISIIDPEGNVSAWTYYPEDDPDGDGISDVSPLLPMTSGPLGYLRSVVVDDSPSPRRTAAAPPARLEATRSYDPVGNVVALSNPRGVVTALEVNQLNEIVVITRGADVSAAVASGQLPQGEAPLAFRTRITRDFNGRVTLIEVENRDGITPGVGEFVEHRRVYDILDNLIEASVEVDATTTAATRFRYDPSELLVLVEKPEGNKVGYAYDERDLPFTVTRGLDSPEASSIRVDYDLNGNPVRITDAEDNDGDGATEVWSIAYDGFERAVEVTDPLGSQYLATHDPASNVVRQRVLGHPPAQPGSPGVPLLDVLLRHDELNRVFQVDEALFLASGFAPRRPVTLVDGDGDGLVTTFYEFDALSRNSFQVEDDGTVMRQVFDGANRAVELLDAVGNRHGFVFDRNSNLMEARSFEVAPGTAVPEQEWVGFFFYDQLDRLVRQSADHTTRFEYDSRDNLILRSDPEGPEIAEPTGFYPQRSNEPGNTTRYVHDGRGLLTEVVVDLRAGGQGGMPLDTSNPFNPDGRITLRYRHDGNSRPRAIVDDNGSETLFEYDSLDRLVLKTNADGSVWRYTHDRDDNVVEVLDPNGTRILDTHDALDRLVERVVLRAPGVAGTGRETFAYDGLSRPVRLVDEGGSTHTVERVYDSLSRLLEESQDDAVCSVVRDGDGKLLSITYPGGRALEYTHDAIDRTLDIRDGPTSVGSYFWIGPDLQRPLKRTHRNGTFLSFLNDAENAGTGYDEFKRPVDVRHRREGADFVRRRYEYNRASVRLSEKRDDDAGLTDRYGHDSAYRVVRSLFDQEGLAGSMPRDLFERLYALDGVGNRREVASGSSALGTTVEAYEVNLVNEYTVVGADGRLHDDKGNLLAARDLAFVFDYKNRLVEARQRSEGALVAAYEYDCLDRRVKKSVFDPPSGALIKETRFFYDTRWQVIEERGLQGTEATYVYGERIDEPIEMRKTALAPGGEGAFFLHQNARGDVVALTDESGSVIETTRYEDFGAPERQGDTGNPYFFQGHRLDPETGLFQVRHRYYDPATGRFIHRDPLFDPQNAANQYTFAAGGPISGSDPLGLERMGQPGQLNPIKYDMGDAASDFVHYFFYDNWIREKGAAAQEHYVKLADTITDVEGTGPKAYALLVGKALADFTGVTELYGDAWNGYDFDQYLETGHQRKLSTREALGRWAQGAIKFIGFIFQVRSTGSALRGGGSTVAELEAQAARRANLPGVVHTEAGRRVVLSAHGGMTNEIVTLPPNVAVRVFVKAGKKLGSDAAKQVEKGLADDLANHLEGVYHGGQKLPQHYFSALGPGDPSLRHLPWVDAIAGNRSLEAYAWALSKAHAGRYIVLDIAACRSWTQTPTGRILLQFLFDRLHEVTPATVWLLNFAIGATMLPLQANPSEPFLTLQVRVLPPLQTESDDFTVAPGLNSTIDLAANDTVEGDVVYELVSGPNLHDDLFQFDPGGTVRIAPLTGSGPVTFTYRVRRGEEVSDAETVTVQPDPRMLVDLEVSEDEMVLVPCLLLPDPDVITQLEHYPMYQFRVTNNPADVCQPPHWHSVAPVFSLEEVEDAEVDPNPPACGWGLQRDVPQKFVKITFEEWLSFLFLHPPVI